MSKRLLELEESTKEIVSRAKEKDKDGQYLYPSLQKDPFLFTIFIAPEALLETLINRPILFLKVLQTNKALNIFWSQFKSIWIIMAERLIEMERGTYYSEVYPFWCIENERIWERQRVFVSTMSHSIIASVKKRPLFESEPPSCIEPYQHYVERIGIGAIYGYMPEGVFRLVNFDKDVVTQKWISLVMSVSTWSRYAPMPLIGDKLVEMSVVPFMLRDYLKGFKKEDSLTLYSDCFVVNASAKFSYDMSSIDKHLAVLRRIFIGTYKYPSLTQKSQPPEMRVTYNDPEVGKQGKLVTREAVLVLDGIIKGIAELESLLKTNQLIKEEPVFKELNKVTVKPYRDKLFSETYATQEKQKEFFLSLLMYLSSGGEFVKERLLVDYGSSSTTPLLQCAMCKTETLSVDPILLDAFCSESCRNHYL